MITTEYANLSRPASPDTEILFPVSVPGLAGRTTSVIAVGRSHRCPECGTRRLVYVSEGGGGSVGSAIYGERGPCRRLGPFGAETCVWDSNRDMIELARRARKAAQT